MNSVAPESPPLSESPPRSDPSTASGGWEWSRVFAIFVAIGIVAGPLLLFYGKGEVARWYIAASRDATYSGDREAALAKAQTAYDWSPNNMDVLSELGDAYMSVGDAKTGVTYYDQALQIAQANYESFDSKIATEQLAQALNRSAYGHALAGTEIKESIKLIDRAFKILGREDQPGMLDTRGYLYFLDGNLELALEDTEAAVSIQENTFNLILQQIRQRARITVDQKPFNYQLRRHNEALAVLKQHRGLVYEALGRTEEAEADFASAKTLGYDPSKGVW